MNKLKLSQVKKHLEMCKNSFTPSLDTYTNIAKYSQKIVDKASCFGHFQGGELVGLIATYDNSLNKNAFITNVSVNESNQRKGIASILLNDCIKHFKNKNYNSIQLEVFKQNKKAITFYKNYNFKIINDQSPKILTMSLELERNYNNELKDTKDHKYAYNFDFDIMHPYMMKSFSPHFVKGNCLELGSFKGDFTKRLLDEPFDYITCVEASSEAILKAKEKIGGKVKYVEGLFENINLEEKYDNIILTHVLEHIDNPILLLKKIKDKWLSDKGKLFIVVPNANSPSRQIAVKMGLIPFNTSITPSEVEHGHCITYTLDVLDSHAKTSGLNVIFRSGIFFKALANFQWDQLLQTEIISKDYLDGCYDLGQQYPDLCSSIMLICKKK